GDTVRAAGLNLGDLQFSNVEELDLTGKSLSATVAQWNAFVDIRTLDRHAKTVEADVSGPGGTVSFAAWSSIEPLEIHNKTGQALTVTGPSNAATFVGSDQDETFNGGGEADTFNGGIGHDTLNGGDGGDQFEVDANETGTINGGAGKDTVEPLGASFGAIAFSNVELLAIPADAVSATAAQWSAFKTIHSSAKSNFTAAITGPGGAVNFTSWLGSQTLHINAGPASAGVQVTAPDNQIVFHGSAFADTFTGGDKADDVTGGAGGDTLNGGGGADTFHIDDNDGVDTVNGGAGADTFVIYQSGSSTNTSSIDGGADADTVKAVGPYLGDMSFANVETLLIDNNNSSFHATSQQWSSFKHVTTVSGAAHFNAYVTTGGTVDFSWEGPQPLYVDASLSTGAITSQVKGDVAAVFGTPFGDAWDMSKDTAASTQEHCGTGNDTVVCSNGQDTCTGGGGDDTFQYDSFAACSTGAPDLITDFGSGDKIDLSHIGVACHFGATPGHTGDVTFSYDAGSNTTEVTIYGDGDAIPDGQIDLHGNQILTADDFVF
ncbi:MAG: M10 family metallopeptidase C-terminal domain-containing protein, partial [Phenylobacterium sp.]